jgi:sugar phosphate permease
VDAKTTLPIPCKRWTRVLLCLLALYVINFIDRNNLGFAVIGGMNRDLGIGTAESGLAGGLFFLGYIILQVPSGILVERFDANRLIMVLSIAWGLVAIATGFVHDGTELLALRFLLGLVDGAVWTSILVVLTRWFPESERGTSNGIWLLCLPLSFIVMGPLSGAILAFSDWRMLFIMEGIPAIILGVLYYFISASRPEEAAWLAPAERDYILEGRQSAGGGASRADYRKAIFNGQVMLMSAVYCFWLIGAAGLFMWIPAIIKSLSGRGVTYTGYISTVPYAAAMIGLFIAGRLSDRTRQRGYVVAASLLGLAVFLLLSVLVQSYLLSLIFLACGGTFLFAPHAPFWAIPAQSFPPKLRGAAMGTISLIGNVGAFIGPYAVGYVREATGSFTSGMLILVASLCVAAILASCIRTQAGAITTGDHQPVQYGEEDDALDGKYEAIIGQ